MASSTILKINTTAPMDRPGISLEITTAIPVTPPVEKLLGNLKKWSPRATRRVPALRMRNSWEVSL